MNARVVLNKWRIGLPLFLLAAITSSTTRGADSVPSSKLGPAKTTFHHGDWPFAPPIRPDIPKIAASERATNAIDHFIAERLTQAGLHPNRPANKAELL